MRGRHVGMVLVVLIALGVVGLALRIFSTEPDLEIISGVKPLSESSIDRVIIRDAGNEAILRKVDGEWWVGSDTFRYPTVELKLEEMWEVAGRIKEAELISKNPENHPLMGLTEEQGTWVEFWSGDQLKEKFLVGDKLYAPLVEEEKPITPWTVQARLCYLKREGEDKSYAIYCQYPTQFDPDPMMWGDPIVVGIPREHVEVVTFSYPEDSFELRVVSSVWMVTDGQTEQRADVESAHELLKELEQVVTSDFPTEEEARSLDFNNPNAAIGISTRQGVTSTPSLLLFVKKIVPEGNPEEGTYYVKDSEKPYVYVLNPEESEKLLVSRSNLLPQPAPTPESGG